ncbi:MAG: hypothetical protein AW07_04048 [Candidatus Accumulibacter sp. SK-11]|nr:MAG: hypothetical protein AW07_04048 [Candidatus Accumulibacter sp. SK-11]
MSLSTGIGKVRKSTIGCSGVSAVWIALTVGSKNSEKKVPRSSRTLS